MCIFLPGDTRRSLKIPFFLKGIVKRYVFPLQSDAGTLGGG